MKVRTLGYTGSGRVDYSMHCVSVHPSEIQKIKIYGTIYKNTKISKYEYSGTFCVPGTPV